MTTQTDNILDLILNSGSDNQLAETVEYVYFVDFANHFVSKMKAGTVLTPKKHERFSASTIRQYEASIILLREFQLKNDFKIGITEISPKLLKAFELFLMEQNLTKNSISLYISKVKAIANILYDEEISFRPIKYSTANELTTKIYFTLEELEKITHYRKLTDGERKAWDVFLVGCFTALRFSTLMKFLQSPQSFIHEYNGASYIDITSDKTGEQSIIPLSKIVVSIINKYNGKIDAFSEVYMNKVLKTICKKAKIDNTISSRRTVGGKMQEVLKEKWELVSTHTARRTFISLAKQTNLTDNEIIGITGHTTAQQMNIYNRSTNLEKVKGILNHDFFKMKLETKQEKNLQI